MEGPYPVRGQVDQEPDDADDGHGAGPGPRSESDTRWWAQVSVRRPCKLTTPSLSRDCQFKKSASIYAHDQDKFFEDFAAVFQKLLELGVPTNQFSKELRLQKTEDQGN